MDAPTLIREARRRAGLTQTALAERVGTTQSSIARLERGVNDPSWSRVQEIVEACGLVLNVSFQKRDDGELATLRRNLDLTTDQRWIRAVNSARFVLAGRLATRKSRG